jgi:hypothetical protein
MGLCGFRTVVSIRPKANFIIALSMVRSDLSDFTELSSPGRCASIRTDRSILPENAPKSPQKLVLILCYSQALHIGKITINLPSNLSDFGKNGVDRVNCLFVFAKVSVKSRLIERFTRIFPQNVYYPPELGTVWIAAQKDSLWETIPSSRADRRSIENKRMCFRDNEAE